MRVGPRSRLTLFVRCRDERDDDVGPVGDQRVDSPPEQPACIVLACRRSRPGRRGRRACASSTNRGDTTRVASGELRNLIAAVAACRDRPAEPRTIERPPNFLARRAGGDGRLDARAPPAARAARTTRGTTRSTAPARADDRRWSPHASAGRFTFISMMTRHVAIAGEHVGERRDAEPRRSSRRPSRVRRVGPVRRSVVSLQQPVVMDDDDAVAREVDVELEAVGAEREAVVECGDGVLGREGAAAAMREDQRPRRREERMTH